ncbi:MAG: zinc ABC transporter substrate-binding protein [Gammaproteobacteria bacterium]|nr:zinc ABC transporter substrate-binding protein [Gammaproteobacteria bacterium]MCW8928146.1 zinc ABC transporter substrate-binding protein [Gammaproteobacteria bacterium]MCW8958135.1 zinc ABC transporter substrate-binding protein [Gammaproteobacteria bacterium]
MRHLLTLLSLLAAASPAAAGLTVFTCEPEWAALAEELGGEQVEVYSATTARQDPHHIQARPSLIAKVRRADLVVCSGAELEVGWLPMLLRQARNPVVLPWRPGHFEASSFIKRLAIPAELDRSEGDLHAAGNPHVHLDPRRVAIIAEALAGRLSERDPDHADHYRRRHEDFARRWQRAIARWEQQAAPLRGVRAVVHHKDWVYLFDWLGMVEAGALEPKPGLPTSPGHLATLKQELERQPAAMILHTAYQSDRAAQRLSAMHGIPVLKLPYTVGGSERAADLFALFDETIERLLAAAR